MTGEREGATTVDVQSAIKRLRSACAFRRLDLVKGTPEKYPATAVSVRLLDLEALLAEADRG